MAIHRKKLGDATVLAFAAVAAQRSETILFPFGDCERYDIAFDRGGILFRIQVKTGRLHNGAVVFSLHSSREHEKGGGRKTYDGEVEAFGVYCHEIGRAYLVPMADVVGKMTCHLRVDEPKRREWKKIRLASLYEFKPDVDAMLTRNEIANDFQLRLIRRVRPSRSKAGAA